MQSICHCAARAPDVLKVHYNIKLSERCALSFDLKVLNDGAFQISNIMFLACACKIVLDILMFLFCYVMV